MELTDELVNEEADGDDVEDKEVEDVLPILFQKVRPDVPLFQHPVTTSLSDGFQSKTLHSTTIKKINLILEIKKSGLGPSSEMSYPKRPFSRVPKLAGVGWCVTSPPLDQECSLQSWGQSEGKVSSPGW